MDFVAKIEEGQRERIREIAGLLEKMGARVRQVQPILGLIAGSSETMSLAELKIDGISSVEPDRKWGAGKPVGDGRAEIERPAKDEREAEERRVVAKRSNAKGKRKG
jgi:hypothetical protein